MNYQYHYAMENEEGFIAMLIYYAVCALFGGGFSIALYVLRSLGVYSIAKRRGLNHAWFAWVPVVDSYLLGCISDQYRYVVKGQNKSKRKWLLGLNIAMGLLTVAIAASAVGVVVRVSAAAIRGASEAQVASAAMSSMLGVLGLMLPLMVLSIAVAVIRYMALYDLYTSAEPKNNVMYLVLSIFFSVTEPFFIFFNRNKDEGMPPRKAAPVYTEPVQEPPVWEEPQPEETEPWQRTEDTE